MRKMKLLAGLAATTVLSLPLGAVTVDLTSQNASGTVNGAYAFEIDPNGAQGTGVLDSFVRVQGKGQAPTEQGYNTDGDFQFDEKAGNFTHSITLGQIPLIGCADITGCVGVGNYLEFILDNNENVNALISLDEMEVWVTGTGSPTDYDGTVHGDWLTLLWSLDGAGDSEILLDYSLNSGSGQGDMVIYVPYSGAFGPDTFITLYSNFGSSTANPPADWTVDAGFEEWAVRTCLDLDEGLECVDPDLPDVPEPSSMLLMGGGLLGLAFWRKRKNS